MRRRDLIALMSGLVAIGSRFARAEQRAAVARVGYLGALNTTEGVRSFVDQMRRLGYVEGQNLQLLFKAFGETPDQLPELAAELARARLDVIVADGSEAPLRAARAAADALPIVVAAINYDPIERGYAKSLAHPGGNVTGVYFRPFELVPKQIELLKAIVPQAARLAIVYGAATEDEFAAAEDSAKAQDLAVQPLRLGDPPYDFDAMFRAVAQLEPNIVLVLSTPAFAARRSQATAAALRYRLPAMFRFRSYVAAGGLMSYGVNDRAMRRLVAGYVAKLLAGAKPADLPIQRADKFELVINLTTAKTLNLTVPQALLARAEEVIE